LLSASRRSASAADSPPERQNAARAVNVLNG
jgi:hypothetical protein